MSSDIPERPSLSDDLDSTCITNVASLRQEVDSKLGRNAAYLVVLQGSNVGEMYKIDGGNDTVIGRGMSAKIRLTDDGISRQHARIVEIAGNIMIEDMKSANGTIVNGEIVERRPLKDGDKIRLGSTTILKFTYHDKLDENFQQQMYDAALRDGLTKAFNKKYFLDRLETEFAYARRHKTALSLLIFDGDHFKKVNDTYGHLAGDYVLVTLAKITKATIRSEDVFARYGGEEFAVICRTIPLVSAGVLGERIRAGVQNTRFEFEGKHIPFSISVGVAALPNSPAESAAQLIAAADAALYEAKEQGRNRVVLRDLAPSK